ncbi:MAG: hypothetical protein Q9166_003149 [cf. Caloplaca sp. 2 TL-2023]
MPNSTQPRPYVPPHCHNNDQTPAPAAPRPNPIELAFRDRASAQGSAMSVPPTPLPDEPSASPRPPTSPRLLHRTLPSPDPPLIRPPPVPIVAPQHPTGPAFGSTSPGTYSIHPETRPLRPGLTMALKIRNPYTNPVLPLIRPGPDYYAWHPTTVLFEYLHVRGIPVPEPIPKRFLSLCRWFNNTTIQDAMREKLVFSPHKTRVQWLIYYWQERESARMVRAREKIAEQEVEAEEMTNELERLCDDDEEEEGKQREQCELERDETQDRRRSAVDLERDDDGDVVMQDQSENVGAVNEGQEMEEGEIREETVEESMMSRIESLIRGLRRPGRY